MKTTKFVLKMQQHQVEKIILRWKWRWRIKVKIIVCVVRFGGDSWKSLDIRIRIREDFIWRFEGIFAISCDYIKFFWISRTFFGFASPVCSWELFNLIFFLKSEFPINNINFCIKTIPTLFNSNNNSQHFPSEEVNFTTAEHRKRHRRRNEILIPFSENYQKIRVISSNIKQHLLFKNSLPLERRQKPFWVKFKTINISDFVFILFLA